MVRGLVDNSQDQFEILHVWILSFFDSPASVSNPNSGAILRLLISVIQMLRSGKVVAVKALETPFFSHCLDIFGVKVVDGLLL